MKKLILTIAILLFAWPCFGANIYIEKSGSQTSPFDTVAKAANTIQHAFDNIDGAPGDSYIVCAATAGGSATYSERLVWGGNDDGDASDDLILQGRAGDTITWDGTSQAITSVASYVTIKNFTITSTTGHGIYFSGGNDYTFEDIIMTTDIGDSGIVFANVTGDLTFTDCSISDVTTNGVYIMSGCTAVNVVATNLTCDSNTVNGFSAAFGATTIDFTNCTFTNNGARGVYLDDISSTINIDNCLFDDNCTTQTTLAGMLIEANVTAYGDITIVDSSFDNNSYYGLQIGYCDPGGCGGVDIQDSTFNSNYCTGLLMEDGANGVNAIVIAGNEFDGNCNGCYDVPARAAGIWIEDATAATIYENVFKNTEYAGETMGRGIIIGTDGVNPQNTDVTLYSNWFIDNYIAIDINAAGGTNIAAAMLYNNTIVGSEYASIKIHSAGAETIAMTMKNNISYNPGVKHILQTSVGGTEDYDYNLFYPESNDFWTWDATTDIDTVAAWTVASTGDANSLNTDPKLVSATDPHLLVSSPCIDAGTGFGLTTGSTAVYDPRNSEADSTAGWSSVGVDVFESQSVAVSAGSYAFHTNANTNPTDLARVFDNIETGCSLVTGRTYEVSFDARHVGTGGDWKIGLGNGFPMSEDIVTLLSSDTSYAHYSLVFTFAAATSRYIYVREFSATNDGGIYFDNFSIREYLGVTTDIDGQSTTHANMDGNLAIGADFVYFQTVLSGAGSTLQYSLIDGEDEAVAGLLITSGGHTIDNDTIPRNPSGALRVEANQTVYNMVFYGDVYVASGIVLTAYNCAFSQSKADAAGDGTIDDTDCIFSVSDFGFRDESTGDFDLTTGSILRSTGYNTGAGIDINGRPTPRGLHEIGSSEFYGWSPSKRGGIIFMYDDED